MGGFKMVDGLLESLSKGFGGNIIFIFLILLLLCSCGDGKRGGSLMGYLTIIYFSWLY